MLLCCSECGQTSPLDLGALVEAARRLGWLHPRATAVETQMELALRRGHLRACADDQARGDHGWIAAQLRDQGDLQGQPVDRMGEQAAAHRRLRHTSLRKVHCRYAPGEFCVSCGPDVDLLYALLDAVAAR